MRILYPQDYLPTPNNAQTKLIDEFVSALESALGVQKTPISIADLWRQDCPDGEEHADIAKYLDTVSLALFNPLQICFKDQALSLFLMAGWNISILSRSVLQSGRLP